MKKTIKFLSILLSLYLLAAFLPTVAFADGDEICAVYSDADKTLTFCLGELRDGVVYRGGEAVPGDAYYSGFADVEFNEADSVEESNVPWAHYRSVIETVRFLDEIAPAYTVSWFMFFENLTQFDGLEKLNTENVRKMSGMFAGCSSLTSLDLSSFDTTEVREMNAMFAFCSSLTSLNLSSFNTEKVENMYLMFYGCSALTELDLSAFSTPVLNQSAGMFADCTSLASLDLSNFDMRNIRNLLGMFSGCDLLSSIKLGPNFRFIRYNGEDTDYSALSDVPETEPYTSKWVLKGSDLYHYSSQELMDNYDGNVAMVGTWMWDGLIVTANIADATVTVADQTYTGQEIRPSAVVTFGDDTLVEGTDYFVTYANNTEVGTASVTVIGTGDYTGTKTVTFEITEPSSISRAEITVHAINGEGGTVIPDVTVTMDDDTLIPDTDYTVDYTFDPETRRGTVTITGIGAFNNSITFSFEVPEEGEPIIEPVTDPAEDPDNSRLGLFDWILQLIRKITEFCRSIIAMFHND